MKNRQWECAGMGSASASARNGRVTRIVAGMGVALGLTLGVVGTVLAQSAQSTPARSEVGHSASAWRDLQASNGEAAPALPMLGAEAGLAYRRYMDSFNSKIPDLYESALNTNRGGSSNAQFGSGSR